MTDWTKKSKELAAARPVVPCECCGTTGGYVMPRANRPVRHWRGWNDQDGNVARGLVCGACAGKIDYQKGRKKEKRNEIS